MPQASSRWRVSLQDGFEVIRRVSQYCIYVRKYSALQHDYSTRRSCMVGEYRKSLVSLSYLWNSSEAKIMF